MQTIMNQTNETANSTKPVVEMRELSVDELDAVSGGIQPNDGGCGPWIDLGHGHPRPGFPYPPGTPFPT